MGLYRLRGLELSGDDMSIFRDKHGPGRAYILRHKREVRKPVRIVLSLLNHKGGNRDIVRKYCIG